MKSTLALFVALAAAGAPPDAATLSKAGLDAERLARIPARMKQFTDKGTIAGAVTLVARRGVVGAIDTVGLQDIESKKPMRPDTIFEVMSMTKPVTGVAIMILVEEGRLALTDPVAKHLLEFRGQSMVEKEHTWKAPPREITIRDLLTHTSGMPEHPPEGLRDIYFKQHKTLGEVVTADSQLPLLFEPGTKWQYSNTGIATLGRIIEVLSGQPYERFLDERIFQPLGMKDSFFFPPVDKHGRIASVYELKDGKLRNLGDGIYRKGAKYSMPEGGLYATASDMYAFYQMMLNGGAWNSRRILSRASVETMTQVHTGDLRPSYGLSWAVAKGPAGTLTLAAEGAFGHGGAFGTYGWIDPQRQLIGVFMIQRFPSGAPEEQNVFRQLAAAAVTE